MSGSATAGAARAGRCEVVLFHSALGLRPGVRAWADRLRAAGHRVHVPDLYGGPVFDDVEAGMRHVASIGGVPALVARSQEAVAALPADLVYAGFSNGAASAELLAATRPGARAAILMHGALPLEAFGAAAWPAGVPVQVHSMLGDPMRDQRQLDAFAASVRRSGAPLEQYDYPGAGHLFADPDHPDFDAAAAELMLARVLAALDRVGAGG
jgi:dienelactone hydrolase